MERKKKKFQARREREILFTLSQALALHLSEEEADTLAGKREILKALRLKFASKPRRTLVRWLHEQEPAIAFLSLADMFLSDLDGLL